MIKLCKTEKELNALIRQCSTLKFKVNPNTRTRTSRPFLSKASEKMFRDEDLSEITNVKQLIVHLFCEFHQMTYSLAVYPEVTRLSAEFDYCQRNGQWYYVDAGKIKSGKVKLGHK